MRPRRALLEEATRDPLPRLRDELLREFGDVADHDTITKQATVALEEFQEARIREFVPVFAWRHARARLRRAVNASRAVEQPEWTVPRWMIDDDVELELQLLHDEEDQGLDNTRCGPTTRASAAEGTASWP